MQPVIILDQFEELFTLAQDGDAARARRSAFITELAGLIENRSPADVKRRLESDPDLADLIDFDRQPYRILLSLREDYLAHLQDLQAQSPSIAQNMLRLTRMNGRQALAAVIEPGGGLVSHQVGPLIVRFVSDARSRRDGESESGITDLAELEVEPSLLSLVCRELNNRRLALGLAEITPELTDRSRKEILRDFYDRSFDELPVGSRDAVRAWIEDALLTDSGFRENVALERAEKALAALGAPPDTIEILRRRRLIRIEERLRVKRVELIHDVLIEPVARSREERQQRQAVLEAQRREEELKARQQAEAKEAQRRERELQQQLSAKRRQVRQVRLFAIGMTVLAVLAGAFFWGGVQQQRRLNRQTQLALNSIKEMGQYLSTRTDSAPELRPVYRKYLAEMDSLLNGMQQVNPGTPAVMQVLAYYAGFQADLSLKDGERGQAASAAMLAAVRAGELARRQGEPESRDAAMLVYGSIARTLMDLDSLQQARAAIDGALGLALTMDTANTTRKSWVAAIYALSGEVLEAQHDSMGALNAARQALLIRKSLVNDSAREDQLSELRLDFTVLGLMLRKVDSLGPAAAAYDSAIGVGMRQLAASGDSIKGRGTIRYRIAQDHILRGQVEGDLGQTAAARVTYTTAITILDSLLAEYPDSNRYRRALARTLGRLAELIKDLRSRPGGAKLQAHGAPVLPDVGRGLPVGWQDRDTGRHGQPGIGLRMAGVAPGETGGPCWRAPDVQVARGGCQRHGDPGQLSGQSDEARGGAGHPGVDGSDHQPSPGGRARRARGNCRGFDPAEHLRQPHLRVPADESVPGSGADYQKYRCTKVGDSTFAAVLVDDFKRLAKHGVVNGNTRRLDAIARAESCRGRRLRRTPPARAKLSAAVAARIAVPRIPRRKSAVEPELVVVAHLVAVVVDRLPDHGGPGLRTRQAVPVVGRLGVDRTAAHQLHRDALLVHHAQHVLALGVAAHLLEIEVLDLSGRAAGHRPRTCARRRRRPPVSATGLGSFLKERSVGFGASPIQSMPVGRAGQGLPVVERRAARPAPAAPRRPRPVARAAWSWRPASVAAPGAHCSV